MRRVLAFFAFFPVFAYAEALPPPAPNPDAKITITLSQLNTLQTKAIADFEAAKVEQDIRAQLQKPAEPAGRAESGK